MGKSALHGSGYIAWATGLIPYIRVLIQQSYVNVAPFLQAAWSAVLGILNTNMKRSASAQIPM
jgi:hypothetical protein